MKRKEKGIEMETTTHRARPALDSSTACPPPRRGVRLPSAFPPWLWRGVLLGVMAFVVTASVSAQQLGATQASGGEQDAESAETDAAARAAAFRAELGQYLYDLEQLPVTLLESVYDSPLSVLEAQRDLPNMTDDELLELEGQLSQIPYWRSLPRLLAASVPTQQYFTPLELAASLDIGGIGFGTEELRGEILDFLADLERLPASLPVSAVSPEYRPRIQRIREQVLTMNSAELIEVQQGIATNSDEWTAKIRSLSVGVRERGGTVDKANCNASTSNCGSSFPNNVICEIGNVVNEIATIPCYVADFAQEAVDLILDGLISFFELLASAIPSPQQIVNQFESALVSTFSRADWHREIFTAHLPPEVRERKRLEAAALADAGADIEIVSGIDAVAAIPCPISLVQKPISPFNFPLLGEMGSVEGWANCERRAKFIADIVKEIFPSDAATVPLKIAYVVVQAVYYIVDYFCLCFEAAYQIKFDDDQEAHRELVTDRFTIDGTQVMIKVSELGQASTLQAVQNRIDAIQSDVAVLDSSVDSLNNDIADVDADVAVVNSKLMTSLARMDDAVAELEEYIALALRLRMEADLVREGELRVGLFQLPGAQGGYLEEVDFLVEALILERQSAGRDLSSAWAAFNKARTLILEGAYKKAYSQYRLAYRRMSESGK